MPRPARSSVRTVRVELGPRSYTLRIGCGLLPQLGFACAKLGLGRRCAVISDDQVAPRYGEPALASLRAAGFHPVLVVVPAGEPSKNLRQVQDCCETLARHRLERSSFVVALGGGVVGDLAGYVAASYVRGVALVQVPTTLLAQVDSSVGGKVGVNLRAGKNLVGAFHQPRLVLCDLDTLQTLPERELRAGLAEVIKYGIIRDVGFFRWLEGGMARLLAREPEALAQVVARSCRIKAAVVGEDETETGVRAILNFGHTLGHALEATAGYGHYLHGEAIAIGMVAAAGVSARGTGLPWRDAERIRRLLDAAGLPTCTPLTPARFRRLMEAMRRDKKVREGEIRFVLAERLGKAVWGKPVTPALLLEAMANTLIDDLPPAFQACLSGE